MTDATVHDWSGGSRIDEMTKVWLFRAACPILLVLLVIVNGNANHRGVCYQKTTRYERVYKTRPIEYKESYHTCCAHFIFCWYHCQKTRTKTRMESYGVGSLTYFSKKKCCSGYTGSPSTGCNPFCKGGCGNGVCIKPGICSCQAGFTGEKCENDINECATNNGTLCEQNCHNTNGSYICLCKDGYRLSSDKYECEDINECDSNNGGCSQSCTNDVGSYYCNCTSGYYLVVDGHGCNDIDECATNGGGCEHNCNNTDGSYRCSCNDGYKLSSDGWRCEAIKCFDDTGAGCIAGTALS